MNSVAPSPEGAPAAATPRDGVRLRPDVTAAEAGRAVVAYHLGRLLAEEQGTIEGRDAEALHQMRVATRRLRAALRAFRDAFDGEQVAALGEEVRWLAGLLGRVRDLDVLAMALEKYEAKRERRGLPPLSWVLAEVQQRHAAERLALLEALGSARYLALKQSLARFAAARGVPCDAGGAPLRERAGRDVRRLLRAVRRAGKRARWGRSDALHALRIAAKRLRYTMEFYRDLFPPELGSFIDAATAVQDHLGSMRDAQLQAAWLRSVAAEASPDAVERQALEGFLRHLRRRARRQYRAFRAAYPSLMSKQARRALKSLLRGELADESAGG